LTLVNQLGHRHADVEKYSLTTALTYLWQQTWVNYEQWKEAERARRRRK
jgi:hypothetical protein